MNLSDETCAAKGWAFNNSMALANVGVITLLQCLQVTTCNNKLWKSPELRVGSVNWSINILTKKDNMLQHINTNCPGPVLPKVGRGQRGHDQPSDCLRCSFKVGRQLLDVHPIILSRVAVAAQRKHSIRNSQDRISPAGMGHMTPGPGWKWATTSRHRLTMLSLLSAPPRTRVTNFSAKFLSASLTNSAGPFCLERKRILGEAKDKQSSSSKGSPCNFQGTTMSKKLCQADVSSVAVSAACSFAILWIRAAKMLEGIIDMRTPSFLQDSSTTLACT